jgi:hypothetical protein
VTVRAALVGYPVVVVLLLTTASVSWLVVRTSKTLRVEIMLNIRKSRLVTAALLCVWLLAGGAAAGTGEQQA